MSRLHWLIIFSFILIFSCRDSLLDLSSEKASLSVGISINRSLYSGDIGQNKERYIALSSEDLSVSFNSGTVTVSGSAVLEEDPDNPDHLIGIVTLENLPIGQEGVVGVETFNADNLLVCDGSDTITINPGVNTVTITLAISQDSPLLTNLERASYFLADLPLGEDRFLRIGPMDAGTAYTLYTGSQGEEVDAVPEINLLTDTGSEISFELTDNGDSYTFTPSEDNSYAIFDFYNSSVYDMQGVLWWDVTNTFNTLVQGDDVDITGLPTSDPNLSVTYTSNGNYIRLSAGDGELYIINQENYYSPGYYEYGGFGYTSDLVSWTGITASSIMSQTILDTNPSYFGISDIVYSQNYLITGLYYYDYASYELKYGLAIRDMSSTNHYLLTTPLHYNYNDMYYGEAQNNYRISVSDSHIALLSGDSSNTANLSMATYSPGTIGSFTTATAASFDYLPTVNNMQLQVLGSDSYILGDSGAVYKTAAGSTTISSSPVFTLTTTSGESRYLGVYKGQYLIASSPDNSVIYIPETDDILTLYDSSNIPGEISSFMSENAFIEQPSIYLFGSEETLVLVSEFTINSTFTALGIMASKNGGLTWTPLSSLTYADDIDPSSMGWGYIFKQVVIDDSTSTIFVGGNLSTDGDYLIIKTYTIQ